MRERSLQSRTSTCDTWTVWHVGSAERGPGGGVARGRTCADGAFASFSRFASFPFGDSPLLLLLGPPLLFSSFAGTSSQYGLNMTSRLSHTCEYIASSRSRYACVTRGRRARVCV